MEPDYLFESQIFQLEISNLSARQTLFHYSTFKSAKSTSGYSRSRFIDEPPKEFLCGLCTLVVKKPTECCKCGQLYCEGCVNELKLKTQKKVFQCLVCCFQRPTRSPSLILKKILGEFKVICSNSEKGCIELIELNSLHQHEEKCLYKEVICENIQFCRKIGLLRDFLDIEVTFPMLHSTLSSTGVLTQRSFVCSEKCKTLLNFQKLIQNKKPDKALRAYFDLLTYPCVTLTSNSK